jgi:hypothetical protein
MLPLKCVFCSLSVSFRCRFPKDKGVYMCPTPDAKASKQEYYVKSKGIMSDHYDAQLQSAISHLVDAAADPAGWMQRQTQQEMEESIDIFEVLQNLSNS